MERLKRRSDFRAVAQTAGTGARAQFSAQSSAHASGFILQARMRAQDGPVRVGFTVSKQVGNAVERNRVRRRLRELVRLTPPQALCAGHDYVLIGRRAALKLAFDTMRNDLTGALRRVHRSGKSGGATGAALEPPPHSAGPAKGRRGKGQIGPEQRSGQHEH